MVLVYKNLNHVTSHFLLNTMNHILKLLRPHQYIKNIFIFLPLFFAGQIINIELLKLSLIGFIAFSLSASATYILNNYHDINKDRQHPRKKTDH